MRPFRRPATLVLAAALLVTMSLPAQAQPRKRDPFIPAAKRLAGMTGGELLTENGRQLIEIPIPERGAPAHACRFAGRNDKVLLATFAPTAPVCVVRPGTSIFWMISWYFCDSDDLLFSEAEQQACALEGLLDFQRAAADEVRLSVNGGIPVNIVGDDRFLALGPQETAFHVSRTPPHEISFSPAGFVAMLKPLPPGRYVVDLNVVGGFQHGTHVQSIIEVVPGRRP